MSKLTGPELEKRRKQVEGTATFGLILICVALVAPLTDISDLSYLSIFKWIYGAGTLIFLIARFVDVSDPEESLRLRRLRRMEIWAGISFGIATFFWFYDQYQTEHAGKLFLNEAGISQFGVLRNTIMFTLVGAVIQIIASWLIYTRSKKELRDRSK